MRILIKYDDGTIGVIEIKEAFYENGLHIVDYDDSEMVFNIGEPQARTIIIDLARNLAVDLRSYTDWEWVTEE